MHRLREIAGALLLGASVAVSFGAQAQGTPAVKARTTTRGATAQEYQLEPQAMDLIKAMSSTLAGAKSLAFTATMTYESASKLGPALAYTTRSEVLLARPDRLRVMTLGDGPNTEFYYDGKMITAFSPAENLVAIAPAPPTVDGMLQAVFDNAAIYFPFADVLGADPLSDLSRGLVSAFVVGQSKLVGGVPTDVVALVTDELFMQLWIGKDDHLPRMMRAVYRGDTSRLRHQLELTDWKLDPTVAADAFASVNAANAHRIPFAAPLPPGVKPPKQAKPAPKTPAP
jgi:hypothetical protein